MSDDLASSVQQALARHNDSSLEQAVAKAVSRSIPDAEIEPDEEQVSHVGQPLALNSPALTSSLLGALGPTASDSKHLN